ncbi:PfaD family polyunsaturated fatty acid/polyketide biosynthesis protein [Pseudobacteriovorax antillogorgiicola]|uniref:PfaD family protein n=1 Tax=Pseudobacteriovorax antillogorgiicola TaxID=1513793 RepID=A0A1Y6CGJ8_9BACT|nr:PfaD family polyunsaturated fatty acid/polyketide biosynthesis protein [Pseudobacteriovorax antillogorgiicola]TCS46917.1 PfaD family protein [Pseudobacteriovorax antillogorgiicola]SMF64168.1 PfaD family protein [Pseudobacteriovorax antillogorgiicola]
MTCFVDSQYQPLLDFGGPSSSLSPGFHREACSVIWDHNTNMIGILPVSEPKLGDGSSRLEKVASLPPSFPEWLGDRSFQQVHGTRFAYVGGAMARGIASADLVIKLAKIGMMGFFGAAGLSLSVVEQEITKIKDSLEPQGLPFGANLIHTPEHPQLETQVVELYLKHGVKKVSASAFMKMTPSIVYYALKGLRKNGDQVERGNRVFAKVSRTEVARQFLSPAPQAIIDDLKRQGLITEEEAALGRMVPVAEDIIVESDSGGHTDNRPLGSLFPAIQKVRDHLIEQHQYQDRIRLGAAGGLGTPNAIAAAYSLGAAFVVIGSVHQSTVEAGISDYAKQMLGKAQIADITMTPSADMFQMGVKVQVLKRGTMMAPRGAQLYKLYRDYDSIEDIPSATRKQLEATVFRMDLDDVWRQTEGYFEEIDPRQLAKAETDPKYKMALIFRWYLGKSSQWPIQGQADRQVDYQIWCGPAMGAFNDWVAGSFLEAIENRSVDQVALNLMEGAAAVFRSQQLRSFGYDIANRAFLPTPQVLGI